MNMLSKIKVNNKTVSIKKVGKEDYLCLSDMASNFGKDDAIKNRMRNKDTLEILGTGNYCTCNMFCYDHWKVCPICETKIKRIA